MKSILIEEGIDAKKAYESLILEPRHLGMLSNPLSVRILQSLANKPGCALDLARSMNEHEQKIYYHLRKLEGAGIVKLLRTEKRFGMTAKIFDVVSPVVSSKLFENGSSLKMNTSVRPEVGGLLKPFIRNGKFDALVVLGDTYSHGKYDMHSTEGVHAFDLAFLFGTYANEVTFPNYKFDTEMTESDYKRNLILVGHPQTNIVIDKINAKMPLFFNESDDWVIENRQGKKIRDPRCGIVIKMENPFAEGKKILVLAGRTRGTQSAVLAFTKFTDLLLKKMTNRETFSFAVQGFDSDGDKVIDEIKVMESV